MAQREGVCAHLKAVPFWFHSLDAWRKGRACLLILKPSLFEYLSLIANYVNRGLYQTTSCISIIIRIKVLQKSEIGVCSILDFLYVGAPCMYNYNLCVCTPIIIYKNSMGGGGGQGGGGPWSWFTKKKKTPFHISRGNKLNSHFTWN